MAQPLPPLPKPLRSVGAPTAAEQARRVDEWARDQHKLLEALRDGNPAVLRRLSELEARPIGGGGGGSVSFGSPVGLDVGGSNADGSSTDAARADHEHALPAFGTTAGTFAEGDHSHAGLGSGYVDVWDENAPPASPHSQDDECTGSAIDPKWTAADPVGGTFAASANAARGYYRLEYTPPASVATVAGLVQAAPDTEFAVIAEVGLFDDDTTHVANAGGIFVAEGLSTTDNVYWFYGFKSAGTASATTTRTANKTAWNQAPSVLSLTQGPPKWFRIRVNGSDIWTDVSWTGFDWSRFGSSGGNLGYSPAYWGIGVESANTAHNVTCRFRRIRVMSGAGSSAWGAHLPGRYVRKALP